MLGFSINISDISEGVGMTDEQQLESISTDTRELYSYGMSWKKTKGSKYVWETL